MDRDAILKALQRTELAGIVTTDRGEAVVLRNGAEFRMKTAMGYFIYSVEELADELSDWEEEILMIE